MKELTQEQKSKIIAVLTELGAVQGCPRCGNDSFFLYDYIFNAKSKLRSALADIEEPKIPSIIVVCERCGFISQHAIGVLEKLIEEKQVKLA